MANNMEDNVSLYESRSANGPGGNYIKFILSGPEKNRFAIGSKIRIKKGEEILYQELHNARGYLSSVEHSLVFGLGDMHTLGGVEIIWPDGLSTNFSDLEVNRTYHFKYDDAAKSISPSPEAITPIFQETDPQELGIAYEHIENRFDDYKNQVLLPWSQRCRPLESTD